MAEKNHSKKIAYAILNAALRAPIRQILFNAGYNLEDIYINDDIPEHVLCEDWEYGYDVKEETYGDMFEMGIIDPLKVTRSALQNAVSVAVTILSTNAIVTMARSYETK